MRANLLESDVTGSRLGNGDIMLVTESLELAIRPGVKNPLLNIGPRLLGIVLRLVPGSFDTVDERVLAGLGVLPDLLALGLKEGLELFGIPIVVWGDDLVPVFRHEPFEILSVGACGVWDVVIGQPSIELGRIPLVVR